MGIKDFPVRERGSLALRKPEGKQHQGRKIQDGCGCQGNRLFCFLQIWFLHGLDFWVIGF